ncbi:2-oxoglutarate and iron-dependent oxygenase domain-containing protein 3 [Trichonephila clavata]|uniref:2-oxoglutarate and iron-dependent oxygenase domain-containing protein 3 n=1 Tax=Trichonephila clavata TaxID=2740835 RepID=A0A8X6G1Z3_TRICU|nr:2-oxoglutarate and iron-dependent oxygenase domain-containing protein 3 [Trichonephila clavata]
MAVHQRKSGNKKKSVDDKELNKDNKKNDETNERNFESLSSKIPWRKIVTRFMLSLLMIFAVYWTSKKEDFHVFASQKDRIQLTSAQVSCSPAYKKDISKFNDCVPKHCGRLVTDIVVTPEEAAHLLRVSKKGLAFGGSSGGASILDLHSGALSYDSSFINIYEKIKAHGTNKIFTPEDFKVYRSVGMQQVNSIIEEERINLRGKNKKK